MKCDQCKFQATQNSKQTAHKDKTHTSKLISCVHCDYKNKDKLEVKSHMEERDETTV